MSFLYNWLSGLNSGLDRLRKPSLRILLHDCARGCADTGIKDKYLELFKQCGEDMDKFFEGLSDAFGGEVTGRVVLPGNIWEICFAKCLCDLHTEFGVNSGNLCECSRESLLYVMGELEPDSSFTVDIQKSVLRGGDKCILTVYRTGDLPF